MFGPESPDGYDPKDWRRHITALEHWPWDYPGRTEDIALAQEKLVYIEHELAKTGRPPTAMHMLMRAASALNRPDQ